MYETNLFTTFSRTLEGPGNTLTGLYFSRLVFSLMALQSRHIQVSFQTSGYFLCWRLLLQIIVRRCSTGFLNILTNLVLDWSCEAASVCLTRRPWCFFSYEPPCICHLGSHLSIHSPTTHVRPCNIHLTPCI